ncbi:MAG: sodium transporter, partial [Deltaproteobacteria bacterium]|nr:sodium transporter [Deltaproteobacteria bacterium]
MGSIDVLIIVAFIVYAIGSGLRNKGVASKNLEEYFLAGRTLPGWKAGLSMAATQFAADTPLLVTGLIATAGIFALWQLWIYALAFLLMGFILASSWRRAAVLTDAELTEVRYGKTSAAVLRGIKAVYFGTIFNCTVLAWVLFAAAK